MARLRIWIGVLSVLASLAVTTARAAEPNDENAVRAVLIYNFMKFTEWPASHSSHANVLVCAAVSDPEIIAALSVLDNRLVRGKSFRSTRYQGQEECDVIYVDSRSRWQAITERNTAAHALTIGAYPGFLLDGGMIEVGIENGRLRFDIDVGESRRVGLRIYPQLLQLARRVRE